jgi:succinate dehydrogenase / fumarate reductase, flavoprotein subunit
LGGNSLTDLIVFGRRAGLAAAEYAKSTPTATIDQNQIEAEKRLLLAPFESDGKENPFLIMEELQTLMQEHVGIQREQSVLEAGLAKLKALQARLDGLHVEGSRQYNPGWHTCRDVRYMALIAECIILSALARKESRGSHWRKDHPDKSVEEQNKNYVCRLGPEGVMVTHELVAPLPEPMKALFTEEDYQ